MTTEPTTTALRLSGRDQCLTVGTARELDLTGKDFTLEAWVKILTPSLEGETLGLFASDDDPSAALKVKLSDGDARVLFAWGDEQTTSTTALAPGVWYHVTLRYTVATGEQALFLNGILEAAGKPRRPFTGEGTLKIGLCAGARSFDGLIAEARIWHAARTSQQVEQYLFRRAAGDEPQLAGCWPLADGTGKNVKPGGAPGTVVGAARFEAADPPLRRTDASGPVNDVVVAELSTNSYVKASVAALLAVTDGLTVEAWVKPAGAGKPLYMFPVVSHHGSGAGWELRAGNGECSFMVTADRSHVEANTTGLDPRLWYHLAGVYDGQTVRLYVNGLLRASTHCTGTHNPYRGDLNIGRNSFWSDRQFEGSVAEVHIFRRARSQLELQRAMYTRLTGAELGLIGAWHLEGDATDATTPPNHGAEQGGLHWVRSDVPLPATGTAAIASASKFEDPAALRDELAQRTAAAQQQASDLLTARQQLADLQTRLASLEYSQEQLNYNYQQAQQEIVRLKISNETLPIKEAQLAALDRQVKDLAKGHGAQTFLDEFVTNANDEITAARAALAARGSTYSLGKVTLDVKMLVGPGGKGMSFPNLEQMQKLGPDQLSSLSLELESQENKTPPGPVPITTPSVMGYTEMLARRKLSEAGLMIEVNYQAVRSGNGPVQADRVVNQFPRPGTATPPGSTVTIFIGRES